MLDQPRPKGYAGGIGKGGAYTDSIIRYLTTRVLNSYVVKDAELFARDFRNNLDHYVNEGREGLTPLVKEEW